MEQAQLVAMRPLVPSHSVVDDPAEHARYWRKLLAAYGTGEAASRGRFPGSNPISLSRRAAAARLHGDAAGHVVAAKSDGVRYALLLTDRRDEEGRGGDVRPVALMVDRAGTMYEVEVVAMEEHFRLGTLLEGELVWRQPEGRGMLFLVFDAVRVKGRPLLREAFCPTRLEAATRCARHSEEWADADADELEARVAEAPDAVVLTQFAPRVAMRPKRFVDLVHAPTVWEERADADHRVDGLIIHRSAAAYRYGRAGEAIYKWKPEHTIDLSGGEAGGGLCTSDGPLGDVVRLATGPRRVEVLPSCVDAADAATGAVGLRPGEVAEYHVDVATTPGVVRLFALRRRPDKRHANARVVVVSTLEDAEERLRPCDLVAPPAPADAAAAEEGPGPRPPLPCRAAAKGKRARGEGGGRRALAAPPVGSGGGAARGAEEEEPGGQ